MKPIFAVLALSTLFLAAPHVSDAGNARSKPKSIIQTAKAAGNFTTLLAAIDAAGLTGTLSAQGKGTFTVFAPTDEAFAKLPKGTVEALLADPKALKQILLYHVLAGQYPAASVVSAPTLKTLNGQSVSVSTADGVKVNDANVIATDIKARNGIIHAIDIVLIPE